MEGHEGYEEHTDWGHGGPDFAQLVSDPSGFSTAEILRIHHADRDYPNPNLLDCIAQNLLRKYDECPPFMHSRCLIRN